MSVVEKIRQRVEELPAHSQTEVLDFVEFLLAKESRDDEEDRRDWSAFSLRSARRGMEDDNSDYSEEDIQERF